MDEATTIYMRSFAETDEDEALREALQRSQAAGIPAVPPETGALLRWFARLVSARHVAEIGTGGGYSGLWLLGGMDPRGTLTTIDVDAEHQAIAQSVFARAGRGDRVRMILGPALGVLPRLADASYELVFVDAAKGEYPDYLAHAKRLLRPGGLVMADNVLWGGRVAGATSDSETEGLRRFNDAVRDDPELDAVILPVGDGLLAAVREAAA
ncbi:MAG: O-methyltransferase [Actinomycetota bacterium]|nr:O-methyltransferase [Actinomycetota bacterium]